MYNFNMRRNIAQEKEKKETIYEYRMCKRKKKTNNKDIDKHKKRKILFTLVNENTHDIQIEHTLLFQAI
jgi:hypothetical protein